MATGQNIENIDEFDQRLSRAKILLKIISFTGRPNEKFTLQDNMKNLSLSGKLIKALLINSRKFEYVVNEENKLFQLDLRFKLYATEIHMIEFSKDD